MPGLLHLAIGTDASHVDCACDVVLYPEFDSQQALDGHTVHPEPVRVKQEPANLRTVLYQVDYLVDAQPVTEPKAEKVLA